MKLIDSHRRQLARSITAMGLLALTGCTPGPAYVRPSLAMPSHYAEARRSDSAVPGWRPAQPGDRVDRGTWWQLFGSSELDTLEARVDASNQAVLAQAANLRRAGALVKHARADEAPTVVADIAPSRAHTSQNVVGRSLAGKTVSDYSAGLQVSWEPDLFDRIGHQIDAANASYQAKQADLASVKLAVQGELAIDYINLRETEAEIALLTRIVADDERAAALVQIRVQGSIASALDLAQAQTQWQAAKAQLIDLGQRRALYAHAIATLIGVAPSALVITPSDDSLKLPTVPVGLPSQLLERRPDIAAAERRVAAANAQVGAATSALFPDLTLALGGGLESSNWAQWATAPSRFWALGPALVGVLFDGGRQRQAIAAAQAGQDAAAADYRQVVLTAFREVDDGLSSLNILAIEAEAQKRATDSAARAAQLAWSRYQAGAADYLEVASTQGEALTQAQSQVELHRRRLAAEVQLIEALGGRW